LGRCEARQRCKYAKGDDSSIDHGDKC
jgi:hypothetical protein